MLSYVIYEVSTGEIKKLLKGSYVSPSEIPNGCWFIEGEATPRVSYVDVSDPNPANHVIRSKTEAPKVERMHVNLLRNKLETQPVECSSLGAPLTVDADPLSLQRMADEIEYWGDLVGNYSTKRKWTLADNTEVFLDRYQLELLYNEARKAVALRRKALFDKARQLVNDLDKVTPDDLDVDSWPK